MHLRRLNESDRARLLSYVRDNDTLKRKSEDIVEAIEDLWSAERFGTNLASDNKEWIRTIYKSLKENRYEKIINDVAKET